MRSHPHEVPRDPPLIICFNLGVPPRLKHRGDPAWVQAALAHASETAGSHSPRDLSNLLWASARLSLLAPHESQQTQQTQQTLPSPGPRLSTGSKDSSVNAKGTAFHDSAQEAGQAGETGRAGVLDAEAWLQAMLGPLVSTERSIMRASPRDAAEMLWSLARIGLRPPSRLVHALLWRFTRQPPPTLRSTSFSPVPPSPPPSSPGRRLAASVSPQPPPCAQDVACVWWSLAALQFLPGGRLMSRLMALADWVMTGCPSSASPLSSSWSAAIGQPFSVRGSLTDVISAPDGKSSLAQSTLIYAGGGRGGRSGRGQDNASAPEGGGVSSAGLGQAIPVILWSLTRLGIASGEHLALAAVARTLASSAMGTEAGNEGVPLHLSPQGTAMVLYSFARAGYRPRPDLLMTLLEGLDLEGFSVRGDRGGGGGKGSAAKGPLVSLTPSPPQPQARGDLHVQTAALVLWSLGRLRFRPTDRWIRLLLLHTVHLLPSAGPSELCNLAKVRKANES